MTFSTEQATTLNGSGQNNQTAADAIVAHEGTHVEQEQALISSGYDLRLDMSHRVAEEKAYGVEERVIETETNRYNPDWSSKKAIDKYLDARPKLYPNLDKPILSKEEIPH